MLVLLSVLIVRLYPNSAKYSPGKLWDLLAVVADGLRQEVRTDCVRMLRDQHQIEDTRVKFILGHSSRPNNAWLQTASAANLTASGAQDFPLRSWEMMPDATPVMTENDTSLSLTLFEARKTVL